MRYFNVVLAILFILIPTESTVAQYVSPQVTISQELININGNVFYMHTVKKRETLFSISKAYGVTVESIVENNPKLSQGLKEGDFIYIRKTDAANNQLQESTEAIAREEAEMSRADRRRARQEERQAENNRAEPTSTGEKEAGEIKQEQKEVPLNIATNNNRVELNPQDIQTIHTVRWYETLSAIAKKYNISEEEILLANSIKSNEISARQKLRIPRPGVLANLNHNYSEQEVEVDTEEIDESMLNIFRRPYYDQLKISLQLPLGSNIDTTRLNPNSNYVEFYQGFLLALEDLRKEYPNMGVDLHTHDMTSYVRESEVLLSNSLNGSDLIIGPIHSEQQKPFVDLASGNNAIFVSPIDSKSEIYTLSYPNFFQITTPVHYQQKSLLSTLSGKSNVIMFYESESYNTSTLDITTAILSEEEIQYQQFSYSIAREGRTVGSKIEAILSKTGENHIIIASDSEAFVFDLLGKLNLLKSQRKIDITVYGTSKWRGMDRIDISYFHNLNLHIPLQYYVDYSNESVKNFVSKFREIYGAEPSPYAFQAYDIACYFIIGMYSRLTGFSNIETSKSLLQSDYNFIVKPNEVGFTNIGVRHLIYRPNFSTEIRTFAR